MTTFAELGKSVECAAGYPVARIDYSNRGRPQRIHADETLCDHAGPVEIAERESGE